jgi:hypothetical protein
MSEGNRKFHKSELPLKKGHLWTAKEGFQVAALDRGAIRFEFPQDWICIPDEDSIKFYDCQPPDDNCRLAVSRPRMPDVADSFGLDRIAIAAATGDPRALIQTAPVVQTRRGSLELAWADFRFTDPEANREARSRLCFARGSGLYALFTFEFWQDESEKFSPIWDHVMDTLAIGEWILDPSSGTRVQRNDPQTG